MDEGPACAQQSASAHILTPTATVSSPWNLGRNRSPRTISDWLRGRKRHSTFMLHSAGTSAMAQTERVEEAACCGRDAAAAGGGCGASGRAMRRHLDLVGAEEAAGRAGRFGLRWTADVFVRSWTVSPCRSEARRRWVLKSNRRTIRYIIPTTDTGAARAPLLDDRCLSSVCCCGRGGGRVCVRLKVSCCWKDTEVKLLMKMMRTVLGSPQRPLSAGRERAWSASVSLKWYPQHQHHSSASLPPPSHGQAETTASHPSRGVKDDLIRLHEAATRPHDATTQSYSHTLAPLQRLTACPHRHKTASWEGSEDCWLKNELRPHGAAASLSPINQFNFVYVAHIH